MGAEATEVTEQTEATETTETTTEETGTEATTAQEGATEAGEQVTDKHGHPGISEGKYARDMKAKDDEIADLKAQIAKASETKESREEFEAKIKKLEDDQAAMKLDYELKLAGCVNTKAAKAIIDDFDGDIMKLKGGAPYLFEQEKQTKGSTGKKPEGAASSSDSMLAEARKAAGIKTKE